MKYLYYRQLVGAVMTEAEAKAEAEEVLYYMSLSDCLMSSCCSY